MPLKFKTYSEFLSEKFPGVGKIQKIGVSIGRGCPNRDGTIGKGGCAYCNNSSFTPEYINNHGSSETVVDIIEKGKEFFARKYPKMKYLAYFQSYTNTYGLESDELIKTFLDVAAIPDVVGIIIGTRPDCVSNDLLSRLSLINREICPVMLEFGAESSHNSTLEYVNRCHTWETTVRAVQAAATAGLSVGLHFIMGLPGETEEMMLDTVSKAVELPVDTLKFHHLQIVRNTRFAREYETNPERFNLFTPERYTALCREIVKIVGPANIAIERFVSQSPDEILIAPRWGLKNYQFVNLLNRILAD